MEEYESTKDDTDGANVTDIITFSTTVTPTATSPDVEKDIVGSSHGGEGGQPFNDQTDLKLPVMTSCLGVDVLWYPDYLFNARFIYRERNSSISTVYHEKSDTSSGPLTHESFMMQDGEKINRVTWYAGTHRWSVDHALIRFVIGIQFHTTAGRTSRLYGSSDGDEHTESYDGFILGHAAGRSGPVIHQLQLTWINPNQQAKMTLSAN